jgi:hypothetical protein
VPDAWEILLDNSTAVDSEDAWIHLNSQQGSGDTETVYVRADFESFIELPELTCSAEVSLSSNLDTPDLSSVINIELLGDINE